MAKPFEKEKNDIPNLILDEKDLSILMHLSTTPVHERIKRNGRQRCN
jgi:hypothetical protein